MSKFFNYHNVLHVIGITIVVEGIFLLVPIPVSIIYHEHLTFHFIASAIIALLVGLLLYYATKKQKSNEPSVKESLVIVSLSWICISIFGSLPYLFTHSIPHFYNAIFETVSGFTTTGSSILVNIEELPKSILFWRALTHWIGGMGIIVMVIAILPYFKIGGSHLMVAEGSYFGVEKIKPRMIDVAKRLWIIYVMLTICETILLYIAGMPLFDAVCHSFATIATGGFSTKNNSIMGYSPLIQYIITVFMILSGMNFTLHYFLLHKKFNRLFKNEEWKTYMLIILISTTLITFYISNSSNDIENSFRQALFQVSSILTATGFVSANYEEWSHFACVIIFIIMLIGASVGSTGGGIKVARYVIAFKNIKRRIRFTLSPNSVNTIKYNGQTLKYETVISITSFIFIYFFTIIVGSIIMTLMGLDIKTASTSIMTTLGGIGPGFGGVGPIDNFAAIPILGKLYLAFNMILGRLEILTVLAIMNPCFYKV